ncbi:LysR family transcriptional regulator [Pendulispora rubella]|uniref:LysR family transcriptional regulator n=1 Tax=Pendulispora rubella TaxID=2741070 RepID=A0ABZ2KRK1_9BACT
MNEDYGRNLDLNLLRVFVAVADCESVTAAAGRLYLTQPAISAALRRLTETVGAPLFTRRGRGIALTHRGEDLLAMVRPHLSALLDAALAPQPFDPRSSDHTFRIGFSDVIETWLLPPLLRALEKEAPRMRIIALPVQFRTVGLALASRQIDVAVTVADDLPAGFKRRPLYETGFVCMYDPRYAHFKLPLREREYFAHEHVIVSYNGDLRGIVEDLLRKTRIVRCSVSSFHNVGAIIEGSALLATIPETVARSICAERPRLRMTELPFALSGTPMELLWSAADDDNPAGRFIREKIANLAEREFTKHPRSGASPRANAKGRTSNRERATRASRPDR